MSEQGAQRTPGPWARDDHIPPSARSVICRVGRVPISGATQGPHEESDDANVAFIIKACNEYEELRDLMRAFYEQVFADDSLSIVRPWAARFREAIVGPEEATR